MDRFLNPDNSAFADAACSKIYVDKTRAIDCTNSVCNTTDKYICNSRPRRFGKSYTADMLATYYSRSCQPEELFYNYQISQNDSFHTYLNQCEVLQLDIQWCIFVSFNNAW